MKNVVNILIYQLIWLLCIFFGTIGAMGATLLVVVHFVLSEKRRDDFLMLCTMLVSGMVVDGTLASIGFFSFSTSGFPIPFWLLVIWSGLGLTPNHSLSWMKHRPVLAFFFGAIGGPVAYWAGVRAGAAAFHWEPVVSLAVLSIVWGVLWTVVMHLSVIIGGHRLTSTMSKKEQIPP